MFPGFSKQKQNRGGQTVGAGVLLFKLLADPTRLKILSFLMKRPEGACVYEIAEEVGVSHSAASHQLSGLEARGVLVCFREGQQVCYEVVDSSLSKNIKKAITLFYHE